MSSQVTTPALTAVSLILFFQLLSSTFLPLSFADSSLCSGGYCNLDISSPGCNQCVSNSSLCASAYYEVPGQGCGQIVMTDRASGRKFYYSACCPLDYPCVPTSYVDEQSGGVYDVSSFWCRSTSAGGDGGGSGGSKLTWLWWTLASVGGSVLFYVLVRLYQRHESRRQQQHSGDGVGAEQPQQMVGRPGPWSQEARERDEKQPHVHTYGSHTYVQMP